MLSGNNAAEAEKIKLEANALYKQGKYNEAILKYSKSIELQPNNATYYSNRAAAYTMLRKYKESIRDCQRAIECDKTNIKPYFRSAKCSLQLGDTFEAGRQLKMAKEVAQGTPSLKKQIPIIEKELEMVEKVENLMNKMEEHIKNEKFEEALSALEDAMLLADPLLKRNTESKTISKVDTNSLGGVSLKWRLQRGELLIRNQLYEEANKVTTEILKADSTNSEAITLRAKVLYLMNSIKIESVQQSIRQALSYDPDNTKARKLLNKIKKLEKEKDESNNLFKAGSYAKAIEGYDKVLEEQRKEGLTGVLEVKVLSNKATCNSKLEKHKEVIKDSTKAIELLEKITFQSYNPGPSDYQTCINSALFTKLFMRRANSYMKTEGYEEAVRDYKVLQQMKGNDREILQALRSAEQAFKQASKKDYYKILGLDKNSNPTESEIKKAYRKNALKYHPDKCAGLSEDEKAEAEKKFKDIGEAYAVLVIQIKREYMIWVVMLMVQVPVVVHHSVVWEWVVLKKISSECSWAAWAEWEVWVEWVAVCHSSPSVLVAQEVVQDKEVVTKISHLSSKPKYN
jgi:DnaJ family protein C protein 7